MFISLQRIHKALFLQKKKKKEKKNKKKISEIEVIKLGIAEVFRYFFICLISFDIKERER